MERDNGVSRMLGEIDAINEQIRVYRIYISALKEKKAIYRRKIAEAKWGTARKVKPKRRKK